MAKYLKKQTFLGSKDVYFIFTSGGYCGISGFLAKLLFKAKHMVYHGHAEFKMPRNYVANDAYPMLQKNEIKERILNAYQQLDQVTSDILSRNNLKARHIHMFEIIITVPFNPIWCKFKLTAKNFYVTDACVGCGKCEKLCPLNNIKLIDKKPIWNNQCTHCMACIGNCPTEAIEYGTITQDKEPYNFGKYTYMVDKS